MSKPADPRHPFPPALDPIAEIKVSGSEVEFLYFLRRCPAEIRDILGRLVRLLAKGGVQ